MSKDKLTDTIKLPILINTEKDTVEIPLLNNLEKTIEIPILKNDLNDTIELPIIHILESSNNYEKVRGFDSDSLDIPSKNKKDIIPIIKKYQNGEFETSSVEDISKETVTLPMSKLSEDGTIELPILRSNDNGLIEIPVYDENELPKFSYVIPDTNLLPKIKTDLIDKYQAKLDNVVNTSIFNLNNYKTIDFPDDLNNYIKNSCIDDLTNPITTKDINDIDNSVLIRIPSIKKKRKYIQMERLLYEAILAVCFIGIFIVGSHVYTSISSFNDTDKKIEYVQSLANVNHTEIEEIIVEESTTESHNEEQSTQEKLTVPSIYTKYSSLTPENINFNELESINEDTVGWLIVPSTSINYPVVKSEDNDFYLNHSFDKTPNIAGWVFMDYRNKMTNISQNTIIYAHNNRNGTMFGTLKNLLSKNITQNIELITKNNKYIYQIFSVYTIPATTDYLTTNFATDEEYREFLDMITNRSKYNFNITIETTDKILTLSTCYTHYSRVVVHAKLIEILE